jgi:UDP-N-acetylmuramoylalanine--D-glutamate ligase
MTAPLKHIRRAFVIGTGVSAKAAITQLIRFGLTVDVVDEEATEATRDWVEAAGATFIDLPAIDAFLAHALDYHLVVPSPAVAETHPVFQAAQAVDVPVWSEPELAFRLYPRRSIGVTGTNGKTTTTELIAAMLNASALTAHACGNIGEPVSAVAPQTAVDDVLVMELSSFQLRFADTLTPSIGVLLNIAPDHLDWHPSFGAYVAAKARMFTGQSSKDYAVCNANDPATHEMVDQGGTVVQFSATQPVALGVGNEHGMLTAVFGDTRLELLSVADIAHGNAPEHVVANVAAAATAALLAGASATAVSDIARSFTPGAHRLEHVGTDSNGVRYINDSKATNAHAAKAALRAVGRCVWLAGGVAKNTALDVLQPDLGRVDVALVFGEAAPKLAAVCHAAQVPVQQVATLEEAVVLAASLAQPHTTVLLAPACASFDQFVDYRDRGHKFAAAVAGVCDTRKGDDGAA